MNTTKSRRLMWLAALLTAAMIPAQAAWADDDDDRACSRDNC
ncbi:MAG: hypothetical protein QNJ05_08400 [Woeseiaceae bacterium]|nr:hypothetical protein [Woeseiaceae bacterium]